MNALKIKMRRNKSGSVLSIAVVMVIVLALIGLSLLRLGFGARLQQIHTSARIAARTAADAGLVQAKELMDAKLASEAIWDNSTLPEMNDVSLPNSNSSFSFTTTGDLSSGFIIRSTGTCQNMQKNVCSKIIIKSAWFGIGVREGVYIKNNATLATIPADGELKIQTNSIAPSKVVLYNSVTIPGDVVVGPGGDTSSDKDSVISVRPIAYITGSAYAAEEPIHFKDVNIPTLTAFPKLPDPVGGIITLNSDAQYNGTIQITDTIKAVGGTLENPRVIYFPGNVTFKNGSELRVAQNSVLALYIGGILQADQGSKITNDNIPTSGTPTDAQRTAAATSFFVYGTPTCSKIVLQNSSDFYGAIYAPDATLWIKNSGNLYGAFVGNDNMQIFNSGGFYFVSELLNIVGANQPTSYFGKDRWWEE